MTASLSVTIVDVSPSSSTRARPAGLPHDGDSKSKGPGRRFTTSRAEVVQQPTCQQAAVGFVDVEGSNDDAAAGSPASSGLRWRLDPRRP